MTAIIIARRPDRVTALTDCAILDGERPLGPGSPVLRFGKKVNALGERALVTGCGEHRIARWFSESACMLGWFSLDAAVANFARIQNVVRCFAVTKFGNDILLDDQWRDVPIVVAGWSEERDCTETWVGTLHAGIRRTPAVYAPGIFAESEDDAKLLDKWNEETDGPRMFDNLRRSLWRRFGSCPVGGFLQLTTITREGGSYRLIHEWPEDRVGQPINPEKDHVPADAEAA